MLSTVFDLYSWLYERWWGFFRFLLDEVALLHDFGFLWVVGLFVVFRYAFEFISEVTAVPTASVQEEILELARPLFLSFFEFFLEVFFEGSLYSKVGFSFLDVWGL